MSFDKPIIQTSKPNTQDHAGLVRNRTIYYGEVMSIVDDTDGGRIKVRIPELDNRTADSDLPDCSPMHPKFFHVYPQVGEMVRVFVQDTNLPMRSRFWVGPIISQPQKIGFDSKYTALSTTELGLTRPSKAPSTYPNADGVYPTKTDVAILGKVNTDIILKENQVHLRAGKHDDGDVLTLNIKNPAHIGMVYEPLDGVNNEFYSNTIIQSDKIALISHDGKPQFKAARMTAEDRARVFAEGHPIARSDVLIEALEVIRVALLTHIHPYPKTPVDKTAIIKKLEELQFELISQKNIVTN